jgi:hypothetical protein
MPEAAQLGFQPVHRIGLLIVSLLVVGLVLELVRRRRFKERYALLWLAASGFVLLIGLAPSLVVWLAGILHVQFLTVFFALSFIFLLGLVLSFSVVISQLSDQNRDLAQEVGLLENRIGRLEKKDAP